jgi:hypothetical protein
MYTKYTKDAENVYAPLVMVSIRAWKRTLAVQTVKKWIESIDTMQLRPTSVFIRQYL